MSIQFAPISPISLTASHQAREVSERFIEHFSQSQEGKNVCSPWSELLNEEQKEQLRQEATHYESNSASTVRDWSQSWDVSENCLLEWTGFYALAKGKHHTIWSHEQFPELAFKRMSLEGALSQMTVAKAAHQFAFSQKTFWCQVPVAAVIELPGKNYWGNQLALYVEQRLLLGMTAEAQEEFWNRVFIHCGTLAPDAPFYENMSAFGVQMSGLIESVGFWDVGSKNFPEVSLDGRCVCITDFENIDLEHKNPSEGINRLAATLPHSPFREHILERYCAVGLDADIQRAEESYKKDMEKYGKSYSAVPEREAFVNNFNSSVSASQEQSLAAQKALQIYDQKGWTEREDGGELLSLFDPTGMSQEEVRVAQDILGRCRKWFSSYEHTPALTSQRCLWLSMTGVGFGSETCAGVLQQLQAQGVVASWYCHQSSLGNSFRIWF